MIEWIDVNDELPPVKELAIHGRLQHEDAMPHVLVSDGRAVRIGYLAHRLGNEHAHWIIMGNPLNYPATHWMPLPAPPMQGTRKDTILGTVPLLYSR
jgi:hypothetical protein